MADGRRFAGALLFDTDGNFLLQQRDDKPGILHPGRIGLFGGHQEPGESPLECVVREVHEELSYFVPAQHFRHIGTYRDGNSVPTRTVELYSAADVPAAKLVVTEGALLIVPKGKIAALTGRLTPSAAAALELIAAAGLTLVDAAPEIFDVSDGWSHIG
ncbi:MAG: NUDIX domain-containing protein [Rhodospirillales bacterium]|nr:NUDIX domain-containing protein [Rhodospirillales bacterium]